MFLIAPLFLPLNERSWLGIYHALIPYPYWVWTWANFDGVNYLDIARYGYHYPNFAYFPLLSFLIIIVNKSIQSPFLATGLVLNTFFFIFAIFFVYKLTKLDYGLKIAFRTFLLLITFPFAYYFNAVYADALFLLLTTASFYFARKSQWKYAGIFGFFASLTRLVGFFLLPALIFEWWIQQKKKKISYKAFVKQKVYFLLLIPMGLLTYAVYLQVFFGDFLLFQKSMASWSQEKVVFPLQVFFRYFKIFLYVSWSVPYFVAIVEFTTTIVYFLLAVYVIRKIRVSYGIFMILVLLLPTFTGTFQSMPRYMLHLFPGFIAMAIISSRSEKIFYLTVFAFIFLQLLFAIYYTRGYFIA